jgi:hypothetical protein
MDGGAPEARSEGARLARQWRSGSAGRAAVVASLAGAVAGRAFSALATVELADRLDAGERADLIAALSRVVVPGVTGATEDTL